MAEMFVMLFFAQVSSIKNVRWNKSIFFDSESPLYTIWEKNGATKTIDYAFGQTSPLSLPLTRIRTLSREPNLKMPTILFILHYIRYKGRVKSQIRDSKVYLWLHRQGKHQLQCQMHLFFNFLCFLAKLEC